MRTILCYPVPMDSWDVWRTFDPYVHLFCDEMRRFKAGCDYELIAILNVPRPGIWANLAYECAANHFRDLPVQFVFYHGKGCDIGSWQYAASIFRNCFMVAVTTRTRPYFDGWLAKMVEARNRPAGGQRLYATCASCESGKFHACLRTIGIDTDLFSRFPRSLNSRDEGVAFEVGTQDKCSFSEWCDKTIGISQIVYRNAVVDAVEGKPFRFVNIYRRGYQCELLTLDKHTDAYRDAGPQEKARLERMCFEGKE